MSLSVCQVSLLIMICIKTKYYLYYAFQEQKYTFKEEIKKIPYSLVGHNNPEIHSHI